MDAADWTAALNPQSLRVHEGVGHARLYPRARAGYREPDGHHPDTAQATANPERCNEPVSLSSTRYAESAKDFKADAAEHARAANDAP